MTDLLFLTYPPTVFCPDYDPQKKPFFQGDPSDHDSVREWEAYCDTWYRADGYRKNHGRMGEFSHAYEVPEDALTWIRGIMGDAPWGNLVFWGVAGTGKSHAAAAAACYCAELTRGRINASHSPLLLSALDYVYSQRGSRSDDIEDAFREAVGARVLVLDDIGGNRRDPTDFELETYTRLLNARRSKKHPTVITTNLSPEKILSYFGDHLGSRILHDATVVEFTGENRRLISPTQL